MADILSSTTLSVDGKPAFADAEPYHYGTGSPPADYYPIGEDNNNTTTDLKVQAPEDNGYSKIKKISGFKINNKDIQYIEAGTFPTLNLLKGYTSAGLVYVTVVYSGRDVVRITLDAYSNAAASKLVDTFTIYDRETQVANFKAHGNEVCPKRLGFILTGAGGGAGGFSWYDANKNGSSDDRYITPGGGGGGGEIIYGVIDVSYPDWYDLPAGAFIDHIEFLFSVGQGGAAGTTQTSDGVTATNPKPGGNGGAGEKSWMRVSITYDYPENDRYGATGDGVQINIAGGGGGSAGGEHAAGAAGAGGSTSSSDKNYYLKCFQKSVDGICVRGHYVGGNGGPSSSENGQNEALSYSIYFGNTPPDITSSSFYTYKDEKTHTALSGSSSNASSVDSIIIPGGHSLGTGGSKSVVPTKGGGGACCKTDKDYSRGADGYIGIYY